MCAISVRQVVRSLIDACDAARVELGVAVEPLKVKKAKKNSLAWR